MVFSDYSTALWLKAPAGVIDVQVLGRIHEDGNDPVRPNWQAATTAGITIQP